MERLPADSGGEGRSSGRVGIFEERALQGIFEEQALEGTFEEWALEYWEPPQGWTREPKTKEGWTGPAGTTEKGEGAVRSPDQSPS